MLCAPDRRIALALTVEAIYAGAREQRARAVLFTLPAAKRYLFHL
jgi:hypothetical protein